MDATTIIALVNALLGIAFKLWESVGQIQGTVPIPTWEELVSKNALLQAKIDTEK